MTPRQLAVLRFVVKYSRAHGWAPTHREIGRAIGARSTATVSNQLWALERGGLVRTGTGTPRAIVVTEAGLQLAATRGNAVRRDATEAA